MVEVGDLWRESIRIAQLDETLPCPARHWQLSQAGSECLLGFQDAGCGRHHAHLHELAPVDVERAHAPGLL